MKQKTIGLSLSGGGYRAAAYHLGTLRKLHQMGILPRVKVISTISGGSITGAYYCLNQKDFRAFEADMIETIQTKSVIRYVLTSFMALKTGLFLLAFLGLSLYLQFTPYAWVSMPVLALMVYLIFRFQFRIFPVSQEIEKAYDKFFFNKAKLQDLPDHPILAVGSTNLQTCRPFTFSKLKMGDSSYSYMEPPIYFRPQEFPVSKAVMASSCVPFAFTPISIDRKFFANPHDMEKVQPMLVDGGVYDNQGIHKIAFRDSSYRCDVVITSDAGNKLPFAGSYNNVIVLLIRTMDVFMERIRNFQMMQNLYENTQLANREVTYIALSWDLNRCIEGFVDNLKQGNITKEVIELQDLPESWVQNVDEYRDLIMLRLKVNVGYDNIRASQPNREELAIARNVGTNLTALSPAQVSALMKQASCMTELQVKLYCPSVLQPAPATL